VSALFRELATLNKHNTGQFQEDYRQAIEYLNSKQRKEMKNQTGEVFRPFQSAFVIASSSVNA
jgi:ABC-type phosphate/phosphonate transport system ATPase subunit